jgi:hypothetical protein
MRKRNSTGRLAIFFVSLFIFYACGTPRPFYESGSAEKPDSLQTQKVDYEIFLVGDTGAPQLPGAKQVLNTLQYQLQQAGDSSTGVFLGDNIYPEGMNPDTTSQARRESEERIRPSMEILNNYGGQSYFIPGNHDWRYGVGGVRAQERYVENYGGANIQFAPDSGCPGPFGIEMGENWYLIVLDSEWWINQSFKTNVDTEGCEYKNRSEVINGLSKLVDEHSAKNIMLSFHHPLFSNGNHGGYYPFRDHVFPLTNTVDNLYLPLPFIGSIYPLYRKLGQSGQDIPHDRYQEFKRQVLEAVEDKENVFFAAGHEHSLSFYQKEKLSDNREGTNHFILSGSGSKTSYARTAYGAEFVYSHKGFAKLVSYENGRVDVEFWIPDDESKQGKLVYLKELIEPAPAIDPIKEIERRMQNSEVPADTVITIAPGPQFKAGPAFRAIWGDHYRDAWATEVDVPVFDFSKKKGGLKVLNLAGGQQSVTVILQDSSGQNYVMRSVQKDPKKSLPEILQPTFVADIAKDQISAAHPFGSIIISPLANAAGVYDTGPELVFVSEKSGIDVGLGSDEGTLFTFESFVSKEWINNKYGKKATEVIGSDELWERMREGDEGTINQRQLVRSRIFDMFIGDWDRHERQWFWAKMETDSSSVYEPVPLDHDNAFFKPDGAIPWLGRRKWALRKFQYFDDDIRDVAGINVNAAFFDRWFMNELPKEEWLAIAGQIQQAMTDSVINRAVEQWPEPMQKLNGATFIKKLKARHDKIPEFARRYYDILSKEVNVFGTDKAELFEVERKEDGQAHVKMYVLNADTSMARKLKYSRTFHPDITNEIRLYGFGEADHFNISGKVEDAIQIRIIGGEGNDIIDDNSEVAGLLESKKTHVYDTKSGSSIQSAGEVKNKTSTDPKVNRYERRSFKYGTVAPLISVGFNQNDGLFLGGGALIIDQGFRKEPFAAQHRITGRAATRTGAFRIRYNGTFTDAVGLFNLEIDADVQAPNFSSNFFGLGNETEKIRDSREFFGFRNDQVDFSVGLSNEIGNLLTVRGGAGYEFFEPSQTDDRFVTSPQSGLTESDFDDDQFATLHTGFTVNTVDNNILPNYGVEFDFLSELKIGINENSNTFGRISSEGTFYHTFEDITTTLAVRLGFATNIGDFNFFQANTLGGLTFSGFGNLRGFLRDRFSGRTSVFHNTELRTKLFNLESFLLPASVGVTGFFDEGRVFADGQSSDVIHFGYGGGVWISPLDRIVLTTGLAFSEEETLFNFSFGFTF